jgi:hypothetical protein
MDNLEVLLTFYCKQHNITYKQGLNEVAAPMIFFHKINVTMANIYNYFTLFIDRFLPNLFHDDVSSIYTFLKEYTTDVLKILN